MEIVKEEMELSKRFLDLRKMFESLGFEYIGSKFIHEEEVFFFKKKS